VVDIYLSGRKESSSRAPRVELRWRAFDIIEQRGSPQVSDPAELKIHSDTIRVANQEPYWEAEYTFLLCFKLCKPWSNEVFEHVETLDHLLESNRVNFGHIHASVSACCRLLRNLQSSRRFRPGTVAVRLTLEKHPGS